MIVDASFVYALLDRGDRRHREATSFHATNDEGFITTPMVLTEIDYMTRRHLGAVVSTAFRSDLTSGAYAVNWWPQATRQAVQVAEQYASLGVSLADASLVALASRLGTTEIATFDERHFRAMRPLSQGTSFRLLPADA